MQAIFIILTKAAKRCLPSSPTTSDELHTH